MVRFSPSSRAPAAVRSGTRRKSRISSGALGGSLGQPARDVVDSREVQRADQFDDADVAVVLVEHLLFMRLTAAARRDAEHVVIGDDAGAHIGAAVEHVQIEPRRQRLADLRARVTLLPWLSSRGENVPSPICDGSAATMPPPTPLLAGMPTR